MKYTQLGKTDLEVSQLCLGCWQLSPNFWGNVDLEPWEAALKRGLDLGINFIDTANAYGDGYAEECLGAFLEREKLRDRFVLATKVYWNFHSEKRHPDTRYQHIIEECENSLKRLRTDHIDLYQVHSWDPLTRPDEVAEAFHRLKREGKVRWFGVSNFTVEQMRLYNSRFEVATLQPKYNALHRGPEKDLFPYCMDQRIGTLIYSPLERGLLTGKYADNHSFGDARDNSPLFQPESLSAIRGACGELEPMAEKAGLNIPALMIRWALTHPVVDSAIIGFKKPEHVETLADAPSETLGRLDWFELAGKIARLNLA